MEYPQYAPVYHNMTGRGTQSSTAHASIAQENTLPARSMQASASQASLSCLSNRLLIMNQLILENHLMKDGQITKKKC